jgi:branched-chain amino acid transport system ATP-binding protein
MSDVPLMTVRGLTLAYGRTEVVHGIDLDIPAGSVVSLIGANGAGKTTTLRGLSGLLRPRAGSILFEGRELAGLAANRIAKAGVIQVPEGRQIFADMTVADNLRMGAYLVADRAEVARRMEAALARFPRLAERQAQLGGLLSGGEQQMLAMGRALMAGPKILLLDEPSMGLAPLFVEEIFNIVAALKREGRTILLVEQNAQAALELADTAYVLQNGRIELKGTGAAMSANPAVAAAYLGVA